MKLGNPWRWRGRLPPPKSVYRVKLLLDKTANLYSPEFIERQGYVKCDHGWSVLRGWTIRRLYVHKGKRMVTEQKIYLEAGKPCIEGKEKLTYTE